MTPERGSNNEEPTAETRVDQVAKAREAYRRAVEQSQKERALGLIDQLGCLLYLRRVSSERWLITG